MSLFKKEETKRNRSYEKEIIKLMIEVRIGEETNFRALITHLQGDRVDSKDK